jgi:hypothetical protein
MTSERQATVVVHDGGQYTTVWDDGTETLDDGQLATAVRHAIRAGLRLDRIEAGGRVRFGLNGKV